MHGRAPELLLVAGFVAPVLVPNLRIRLWARAYVL